MCKEGGEIFYIHLSYYYLCFSLVSWKSKAKLQGGLVSLREILGNTTMEFSFIFKSLYSYRSTYELEYSYAHTICIRYELDYS